MNYSVSERIERKRNLDYIVNASIEPLRKLGAVINFEKTSDRAVLNINLPDEYARLFEQIVADKIADVIAVNYKYEYFKKHIRTVGVDDLDYEMLIAAIISADLDDDKAYILNSAISPQDFSIDGFFNFRLRPLKEKWAEIVTYIPTYFNREKLYEFISYIICEKKDKLGVVCDGKVYDRRYNRMLKNFLAGDVKEGAIAREIILCGFSEIALNSKISEIDEKYLVRFFGEKIFFKKEKIT